MGWQTFGKLEVKNDGPFEYNPHYVRLSPSGYPHKWTSLENEGYFGIGVKKENNTASASGHVYLTGKKL